MSRNWRFQHCRCHILCVGEGYPYWQYQGGYKEMFLSWLTNSNSALVYEPKCGGGRELRSVSQWVQVYTGAQINFEDLTPYFLLPIYFQHANKMAAVGRGMKSRFLLYKWTFYGTWPTRFHTWFLLNSRNRSHNPSKTTCSVVISCGRKVCSGCYENKTCGRRKSAAHLKFRIQIEKLFARE
jgi:hypothetical protein